MIGGKTVLAIIPARGGSKGLPGKNIRPLAGKPLIGWTIEAARASKHIDRLIVSSEDEEILSVARRLGCEAPFVRPAELARDDTPGVMPVLHALEAIPGHAVVVLLQPTSPMRNTADIDGCIELQARGAASAASVAQSSESPWWTYAMDADSALQPVVHGDEITRRQDAPKTYVLNGAVYAAAVEWVQSQRTLVKPGVTAGYPMPRERSVDIDTELDFEWAEFLMKQRSGKGT